jgi:ABC-2 type transport system permease protein
MVVELVVALWAGIAAPATTRLRGLVITSWAARRDVPALWAAGRLLAGGLLLRLRDA